MAGLILDKRYVHLDPEIENWNLDSVDRLDILRGLAVRDFTHKSEEILKTMRRQRMQT